ncbi:MAG: HigA family addiction module antidote protein [Gammaproteobacteria bacterium]|nr:HigA family addiction module antidote protein [Gammaproteobacteria bacterium]
MIDKPRHPGLMVKSLCLEPLGLSVSEGAKLLHIARPTLSKLVNGRLNISPEMAMRLSIVFNTSAELWINLQAGYDLWRVQKMRSKLHLHPFVPQGLAVSVH